MDIKTKERLKRLFDDILTFSESREDERFVTKGISKDSRVIMTLWEKDGILEIGSLQLALPEPDDLAMFKLSCSAIIFLTCLFPEWRDIQTWITQTISQEIGLKRREFVKKELARYVVYCRHDKKAEVLDFQFQKK